MAHGGGVITVIPFTAINPIKSPHASYKCIICAGETISDKNLKICSAESAAMTSLNSIFFDGAAIS